LLRPRNDAKTPIVKRALSLLLWSAIAGVGALAYLVVTVHRGEPLSAAWVLVAAFCTFAVGYRFYSKWIAAKLLTLDDRRGTPCEVHEDGRDFVRTHPWIVFGHHFAAISGPGPLVGPVLAAQFGYVPSTLWLLIGVVLGGAVQDFIILVASMRRDGKSLGEMVKDEIGSAAGLLSLVAIVSILIILIAVLGLVVVKALAHSPWGTFTIASTLPIAIFMGLYLRFIRPGRVLEVSVVGVVLLLLSVWYGRYFHEVPSLAHWLTFEGTTLAWAIIAYGLCASILPVWLLLAPRDYLSTFMKLGTIAALAIGILVVLPPLRMPPLTRFIDGTGPVFSGGIFPFCFVTIACGAISGFHTLIASGTTPKLITRETHARAVGYGSMLLESFVAIMALVAACTLDPGVYFAMNAPAALVSQHADQASNIITQWGFPVTSDTLTSLARDLGENTVLGRAGGAPTLAVGMANVFSSIVGGKHLMAVWYHFAIMFEALFILTTVDAGTRVGRFLVQAMLKLVHPHLGNTRSWTSNLLSSVLLVSGWGYFLYQGVIDPLGGINSLWPLFGIANQLLSVVALCLATTILIKMGRLRTCIATLAPLAWVASVTFTAAWQKIFSSSPSIGFLSAARGIGVQLSQGTGPISNTQTLVRTQFNLRVDAVVAGFFLVLVSAIVLISITHWAAIISGRKPRELKETAIVWLSPEQLLKNPAHHFSRTVHGVGLFCAAMVRQLVGEASPVDNVHTSCASDAGFHGRIQLGKDWAKRVDARSEKPRCC
jgi:carbon starvation protein